MSGDVCVIIPCKSWPQYFEYAFNSVLEQTVPPACILLVMDGVASYNVPDVTEILIPESKGVAHAMNTGAKFAYDAGYEWIFRLDEDDMMHPECLEKMLVSARLCPNRDIHYSDWVRIGDWFGYETVPDYHFETLLRGPFMLSAALMHTLVWKDVRRVNGTGWDETMRGWEDYLFWLESGALGHLGARVGLGLVYYRKHAKSVSDTAHSSLPQTVAYMRGKLKRLYGVDFLYQIPAR